METKGVFVPGFTKEAPKSGEGSCSLFLPTPQGSSNGDGEGFGEHQAPLVGVQGNKGHRDCNKIQ